MQLRYLRKLPLNANNFPLQEFYRLERYQGIYHSTITREEGYGLLAY